MGDDTGDDTIVGRHFVADLGGLVVDLHFESSTELTFTIRDGGGLAEPGYRETVATRMIEVRPNVYLTSWQEASGATVTHLEDFERGVLHSNATLPDGTFVQMAGTITPVDGSPATTPPDPAANAAVVRTAMRELFENGDLTALDRYWAEPYVQHTPGLPNGLDALRAAAANVEGFSWTPHRMVAEGDLVMAHSRVIGWAPEPLVIVDIFRLEDQRIVEHWDVVQAEMPASETASGNPMV